ncbi:hypothetical protein ERX46_16755 [Brumimicrobium glaciale]|uniref:Peptidase MA-like domain-containing protein n=1 Tax=Brumimicrobium glaciale TaxID=200475 RepID=A0A4Q4KE48_9FLAO|nr:hypothetical protein [Brumimicrobium glaciale]RYM31332.1 hypothetical protein ERX46_16755 [Brumimicrobium glaciale]
MIYPLQRLILTFTLFISPITFCQNIFVDQSLKQSISLYDLEAPLQLWLDFLISENDISGSKYWNIGEVNRYSDSTYFQLHDLDYFNIGDKVKTLQYGTTVLSITQHDSLYKITSKFQVNYNDSISITPFIFHVYAKKEESSGALKLFNPYPINLDLNMTSQKVGFITYVYPTNHKFNKRLARKQSRLLKQVAKDFAFELSNYQFVFSQDKSSFFELRGYDFHFENIGLDVPSGKADVKNGIVYSHGCNEFYPHELIHLFLNPKYPNAHSWFIEGFATYFGQSRGQSLEWHLQKLKNYLNMYPEIDLNTLLNLGNMDYISGYKYVLGGFFIQIAYEQGGSEKVKQLLNSGSSDEDFYLALESVLGIKQSSLNEYIREYFN